MKLELNKDELELAISALYGDAEMYDDKACLADSDDCFAGAEAFRAIGNEIGALAKKLLHLRQAGYGAEMAAWEASQ
jgi:hypothetical protein